MLIVLSPQIGIHIISEQYPLHNSAQLVDVKRITFIRIKMHFHYIVVKLFYDRANVKLFRMVTSSKNIFYPQTDMSMHTQERSLSYGMNKLWPLAM